MLVKLAMIAVGGAVGALCRYGLCGLVSCLYEPQLKLGTIVVNLIGCFLMGLAVSLVHERFEVSESVKILIMTGFLGAFTTFSTYTLESVRYIEQGKYMLALSNIVISTVISLPLLMAGMKVGSLK